MECNVYFDISKKEKTFFKKLENEIYENCKWFISSEDSCCYFIVDDFLYGLTVVDGLDAGNLSIMWIDNAEFNIELKNGKEFLLKSRTKDFTLLDFDDMILLYTKINMNKHLKNLSDL